MPYAIERGDVAGAVVAVVKNGEVIFAKGYGFADVEKHKPVDAERTMFRPGFDFKAIYLDRGHAAGRTGQAESGPRRQ